MALAEEVNGTPNELDDEMRFSQAESVDILQHVGIAASEIKQIVNVVRAAVSNEFGGLTLQEFYSLLQ